jgi:hypothetical protein
VTREHRQQRRMQGASTDYYGVIEQADDGYEIGDEVDGGQGVAAARGDQRSDASRRAGIVGSHCDCCGGAGEEGRAGVEGGQGKGAHVTLDGFGPALEMCSDACVERVGRGCEE